jgi:hypothetical protein
VVRLTRLPAIFQGVDERFPELFYDPEDGGDTFLRNVGYHSTHYTASYPRRRYSSDKYLIDFIAKWRISLLPHVPNTSCNTRRP